MKRSQTLLVNTLIVALAAGCTVNPNALTPESERSLGGGTGSVKRPGTEGGGGVVTPGGAAPGAVKPGGTANGQKPEADGHDHKHDSPSAGGSAPGVPHGLSHKEGELTAIQALKGVTPVAVSQAAGLTTTVDGLKVVIPPNALTSDGQLRIRRVDNSDRPIMPKKIPGMSFWVDLGGAQIAVDQAIKVTGPVEEKFIKALEAKDKNFDPNNYNLTQVDGKWMLTMSLDGPQTSDKPPTITNGAPFFTTIERADVTSFPITWFSPQGPLSNTGYELMGAEGQDHLDGFQTFEDLRIDSIQEWLTDEEAASERFRPLDLTRIKTKDANGNPIELDAGSIDPNTGRWRVATGKSSFNPVTHQQNCDFADAGCPDSGAVAKSLAMFNHVVTSRHPSDKKYPDNLLSASGQADPNAGKPHPAAGKLRRPPADLLAVVDNYRKIGSSCDTSKLQKVWAKAVWKSDVKEVHLQPAVSSGSAFGPFVDFKGLEGQAGGEVTVGGRVRPVDGRGMAFEWLKSIYNVTGYYHEPRNKPAGMIVGFKNVGVLPDGDNESNPIIAYIPRYSPKVQVQLWGDDVTFQPNDQVTLKFKIDEGAEQTASEIIPANENVASALPGEKIPQLSVGSSSATFTHRGQRITVPGTGWAQPFEFYAKLDGAFNQPAGRDPARKLTITSVRIKRLNRNGEVEMAPMMAHPESLADAKWVPGTPSAGVWLNSRSACKIRMVNTEVK